MEKGIPDGDHYEERKLEERQSSVPAELKPVAEFGGLSLTPQGTNEFWGWVIGDSADVLVSGMKLYRIPPDAAMSGKEEGK